MRTGHLNTAELIIVLLAYFLKQQVLGGKEGGSISRNCVGAGRTIIEYKAPKICYPVNLMLSKRYSGIYAFELFTFSLFCSDNH